MPRSDRGSPPGSAYRSHRPAGRRGRAAPDSRQQPPLKRGSLSISAGRFAQPDVGMTPDHAERRTRRIEQDAVVGHSVPPGAGAPASPCTRSACRRPRSRFSRTRVEALGIDVDGRQLGEIRLPFRHQRRFAARRRAGIEHPLTRRQIERKGDALRSDDPARTPNPGRIPAVRARRTAPRAERRSGTRGSALAPIPAVRSVSRYCAAVARRLSTRSHIGARVSPAASSWVQRTGQSARSRSASHTGDAWRAAGVRATSASRPLDRADIGAAPH